MSDAPTSAEKGTCDDWTKIALHCKECGVQFFRKVKGQRYCDEHRHLAGAEIHPKEAPTSKSRLTLVERLRMQDADLRAKLEPFAGGPWSSTYSEAADEIERLNAENHHFRNWLAEGPDADALIDERLRTACVYCSAPIVQLPGCKPGCINNCPLPAKPGSQP